jgi:O-antigen/teichoic acid export membrane protein
VIEARSPATGRILRGLTANVAGNLITIVIQLVTVPVLLAAWGVATYGNWLVLSAIPFYLALSDLGFSTVAGNRMTILAAEQRLGEAIALGRRAWSIVLFLTLGAVTVAIAAGFLLAGAIFSGAPVAPDDARLVLTALFCQVGVTVFYSVLDTWYRSAGRYPLGVAMRQLGRLIEFGAIIVVVLAGGRPVMAAVAFLAGSVVGFGLSLALLHRVAPFASFRLLGPYRQTIRELLSPGLAFLSFPVSVALSVQGLTIVVGAVLGSAAVVTFTTTRTLTRIALQLMSSVNLAIWPELSRTIGTGRLEEARTIQRRAVQLSLIIAVTVVALLAILAPAIISLWTHGVVVPPPDLLATLLLVVVANSFWYTLTTSIVATNRHIGFAMVYLASTVAALILAVWLTFEMGLVGAGLSLLAIDVVMLIYVFPATMRVVGDSPGAFLRSLVDIEATLRSLAAVRMAITGRRSTPAGPHE